MKNLIAIVNGEPNSINSEIIVKSWKKLNSKIKKKIFLIGNFEIFKKQIKKIKLKINIKKISSLNDLNKDNSLKIFDIPLIHKSAFKVNKKENSLYVKKCLNFAHKLATKKDIVGFINAPIDKQIFKKNIRGVTEFLAKKNYLNDSEVMLIHNDNLAVTPITTHIPLKDISKNISKQLIIKKIITLNIFYKKYFKKSPKIAILGLNPHNNEFRIGSEEVKIIIPAIKDLKQKKINVLGPFPADTIFNNKKKLKYDVIVGMYHDQVLAPFKALYDFDAINITLGLKYIRMSPDHGTGKDLIGLNKASHQSLLKAIIFLEKLCK